MQDKKWQVADTLEYAILKENAKANRNHLTEAESAFWSMAKSSGLGEKCRRQYIIGEYIIDFFFRESNLIVELDGGYHFTEEQQQEDTIRQNWLLSKGYTILRFTNEQILCDTENSIKIIQGLLKSPKKQIQYETQPSYYRWCRFYRFSRCETIRKQVSGL